MASPYTTPSPPGGAWQGETMRSVTPATNNTRYTGRYPSAPRTGQAAGVPSVAAGTAAAAAAAAAAVNDPYRSMTPNRFGMYNRPDVAGPSAAAAAATGNPTEPRTPSSTGLIRLSLKKPMGIVFEPMYDPNQPAVQRGVRICDLPRTGAAALSRKLQVGDELLQINDTTVSRMTFDEIMDFIIEADPESVNLLFRRPRKETLQARQGVQQKLNAAANKDNPSTVKWVDEKDGDDKHPGKDRKSSSGKKKPSKKSRKPKKGSSVSEEEETLQSSTVGDESYEKSSRGDRKKSRSRRGGPYESESFLDLLIDTICSNSNNMCRDAFRNKDDDYSDDEDTLVSELDEDTYATYDESLEPRGKVRKKHSSSYEDETEDKRRHSTSRKEKEKKEKSESKKYVDDGTLESEESLDRVKDTTHRHQPAVPVQAPQQPLGLAPKPPPQPVLPTVLAETEDETNPAPIKEVEYDDRFDHGADVSVMESLGGPSLLIEKQRAAQAASQRLSQTVPDEIINTFGMDYPAAFGLTREQTIQRDPLKYYTYVVKKLLEQHEPEKVRLLDKLLAKYKGREDHLVQKLSVRYNRADEGAQAVDQHDNFAFTDAVKKSKASSSAAAAVSMAKDRLQHATQNGSADHEWPEKEEKEPDMEENEMEESESGSEYSRDSVDGTSPAVIAQVSELLNYVYGKTSVPGQIDRVSTIMRAYEGREAVLLELLETKALIKANKEKENADNLPSFLRNSHMTQAQKNADELEATELPPVTPMATQDQQQNGTVINDDISSMSGVSSPAAEHDIAGGITATNNEIEAAPVIVKEKKTEPPSPMKEVPKINAAASMKSSTRTQSTPVEKEKKKKKGLFGGLFGKKKRDNGDSTPGSRTVGSRTVASRNKRR